MSDNSVLAALEEDEAYLYALLSDPSGIDTAELLFVDRKSEDNCFRLRPYQWCLAGETRVATKQGYRAIRDILGPVTLLTESPSGVGRWVEAEVKAFGAQKLWQIELERYGTRLVLYATAEHRWFADTAHKRSRRTYPEVTTSDLVPGMYLRSIRSYRASLVVAPYGVVHGLVWGDGTRHANGMCHLNLWGEDLELAPYLIGEGRPLNGPDVNVPGRQWTLLPYGFKDPVSFAESPSYLYGWLAGYFAADGSVSPDGTCQIDSTNRASIELVRDVCLRLGITTGPLTQFWRPETTGVVSTPAGWIYRVTLVSSDLEEQFFLKPSHRQKWLQRPTTSYRPREWRVVAVRETDRVEQVYCAVVPETHSFVLDGDILTGNCWYRSQDPQQAELSCRTVGKSLGIQLRAVAHVLVNPGYDMGITAPERVHLDPVIQAIEDRLLSCWLTRELLPRGRFNTSGGGTRAITHNPFLLSTVLGSRIEGRLPQRDGHGVKGMHVKWLELDEAQDYPKQGYMELIETCTGAGTQWRCHGVVNGVGGWFYDVTKHAVETAPLRPTPKRSETDWTIHRIVAMCVAEGQLVMTSEGWVPIQDILPGMLVLTHRNRWRIVRNVIDQGEREVVKVQGHGHPGLIVTPDHPIWARQDERPRSGGSKELGVPRWVSPENWTWRDPRKHSTSGHWTVAPTMVAPTPLPPRRMPVGKGYHNAVEDVFDPDWLWLFGLYLAEGSARVTKTGLGVTLWTVANHEVEDVTLRLKRLGLRFDVQPNSRGAASNVRLHSRSVAEWLLHHGGHGAATKRVPMWVLSANASIRGPVFEGLIYGNGGRYGDPTTDRPADNYFAYTTVSRELAVGVKCLATSLGYSASLVQSAPRVSIFPGQKASQTLPAWRVKGSLVAGQRRPQAVETDGWLWGPIRSIEPAGVSRVYDLEVEEDESFVVEGVVVHNCRPDWTDKERQAKIEKYGSRDAPDYGRNVLGLPGPAENVIFVLHRLIKCCCDDPEQPYNTDLYVHTTIRDTDLDRENAHILDFLDLPASHRRFGKIYIGMDVGYINDPSEVLVFAECTPDADEIAWAKKEKKALPRKGEDRLQLLHRISLRNIPAPDQVDVILALIDFYHPISFAMDRTGNGLPLYQAIVRELENKLEETRSTLAQLALSTIKGFAFDEKVLVEIDPVLREQLPPGLTAEEIGKEAGIYRRVIEVSTDELRELVDTERLWIPYDVELISQFNGQTYHYSKLTTDLYGRRRLFSDGDFHCLDAARMAALARKQQAIDAFLGTKEEHKPVLDAFFTPTAFRGPSSKDRGGPQPPRMAPQGHRQGMGW